MIDLAELFAACVLAYARKQPAGILTGQFYVIGKDARDAFNLPYSEKIFLKALKILEEVDCLKIYRHQGMPNHYRIDSSAFDKAFKPGITGVRDYVALPWENKDSYLFLESYADLGQSFLDDALVSYDSLLDEAGDVGGLDDVSGEVGDKLSEVDSSSWTGLPKDFVLGELRQTKLKSLLAEAERNLDSLDCQNSVKATTRSYIIAMQALAESPDPQVDLIWQMLNRANAIAGVASLFVSIFSLFVSVAH